VDTTTDAVRSEELRREIAARREDIGRDLEVIGDRVSPGRMADRTKERTRRRVSTLRDRVMGPVDTARTSFGDAGNTVSGAASSVAGHDPAGAVTDRVEGSPIAMGLVAFGIGFVAGSIIPATRTERQAAQQLEPAVTRLAQDAADVAKETGEHLAPVAQDEVAAVKGDAEAAIGHVTDKGKEEASALQEDARPSS
jgi:ElaB/YqjD/DUF883 family membrane-anchored ribosome-binding protein